MKWEDVLRRLTKNAAGLSCCVFILLTISVFSDCRILILLLVEVKDKTLYRSFRGRF